MLDLLQVLRKVMSSSSHLARTLPSPPSAEERMNVFVRALCKCSAGKDGLLLGKRIALRLSVEVAGTYSLLSGYSPSF